MKDFEKVLYNLSLRAYRKNEIPVAAIVVRDGKIISKSYNKRKSKNNPLYHAEVQAIIKASKKLKDWRLTNCDLYVTLKPCHMCEEIIKESRIKNVFYFSDNIKNINYKTEFNLVNSNYSELYKELLTNFFKNLR